MFRGLRKWQVFMKALCFSSNYQHNGKSNGKYDLASSGSFQFMGKGFVFLVQSVSAKVSPSKSLSHEICERLILPKFNECSFSRKLFLLKKIVLLKQNMRNERRWLLYQGNTRLTKYDDYFNTPSLLETYFLS